MNPDDLTVQPITALGIDELLALYEAVGWSAYTKKPEVLQAAIAVRLSSSRRGADSG